MANTQPPQVLLLGADTKLGSAVMLLKDGLVNAGKLSSVIPKNAATFDARDISQVKTSIKALLPDVVINCNDYAPLHAAYAIDTAAMWESAVVGADNVAKVCALHGIPLIHVSSHEIFGRPGVQRLVKPFSETDCVNPATQIGLTHVGAEHTILRLGQYGPVMERGFKYFIVRPGPIFGFIPGLNAAASALDSLVGWAGTYASGANNAVRLADDVTASPVCSADLAKFVLWLTTMTAEVDSGTYNFGNSGYPTVADYGELLYREIKGFRKVLAESRASIEAADRKRQLNGSTPLDCSKVTTTLGYKLRDWAESATIYAKVCNRMV